jgi:hypothetical protein
MLVFALPIALGFGAFRSPADPAVPARTSYSGEVVDSLESIGLPLDGDWPSTQFTTTGLTRSIDGSVIDGEGCLGTGAYATALAHDEHGKECTFVKTEGWRDYNNSAGEIGTTQFKHPRRDVNRNKPKIERYLRKCQRCACESGMEVGSKFDQALCWQPIPPEKGGPTKCADISPDPGYALKSDIPTSGYAYECFEQLPSPPTSPPPSASPSPPPSASPSPPSAPCPDWCQRTIATSSDINGICAAPDCAGCSGCVGPRPPSPPPASTCLDRCHEEISTSPNPQIGVCMTHDCCDCAGCSGCVHA